MMGVACGTFGKEERCLKVLVGKQEGKRPLARLSCRWVDIIKMDHKEIGWYVNRTDLARVNTEMNMFVV
jgi:hypothetical protein